MKSVAAVDWARDARPVDVREIHPDDPDGPASIAAFTEVTNAARRADAPWLYLATPYRTEMDMRWGWDGEVARYFLATEGGAPVGAVEVATSDYDNLDLAWVDLRVHPDHRRRGLGSALLEHSVATVRAMGRDLYSTAGWEDDGVRAFAARHGLTERSREVQRRQVLADLPAGLADDGARRGRGARGGLRGAADRGLLARRHAGRPGPPHRVDQRRPDGRPRVRGREVLRRPGARLRARAAGGGVPVLPRRSCDTARPASWPATPSRSSTPRPRPSAPSTTRPSRASTAATGSACWSRRT